MSRALYENYRRKVFELAKTLVVKHSEVAKAINTALEERGYVVQRDVTPTYPVPERTWKYYLNMSGVYHKADQDKLYASQYASLLERFGPTNPTYGPLNLDVATLAKHMYVFRATSDSPLPVPVVFDLQLLIDDPILANEYVYGTRFYKDLVRRYPDYEELILGILNPTNINIAIGAEDGDVLYCGSYFRRNKNHHGSIRQVFEPRGVNGRVDPDLVEENETTLIPKIEDWIKGYLIRWHNKDYAITDDLYVPTMLGLLYMQIPTVVMNLRFDNCKTPEAHSYHIREYLESHGKLSKYIPALSKKQSLYLYRNIRQIEANVGKQETFDDLIQNLLVESRVPLAGYDVRHNLANMPGNLYADVQMIRLPITAQQVGVGSDIRAVRSLLDQEIPYARENYRYLDEVEADTIELIRYGANSRYPSKVLESSMIDRTDVSPWPLAETLLNYWLYLSVYGEYNGTLYVTHPTTNERLQLSTKDAFILAIYCYNRGYGKWGGGDTGLHLPYVPTINARMIERVNTPPVGSGLPIRPLMATLKDVVEASRVSTDTLVAIRDVNHPIGVIANSGVFYTVVSAVNARLMDRYAIYVGQEDKDGRAQAEFAAMMMYWDEVPCDLADGQTIAYPQWLIDKGIITADLNQDDFIKFASDLLKAATGITDSTNNRLRDMQAAVINIMKQFSSYSVQYLYNINNSPALLSDRAAIRSTNASDHWFFSSNVSIMPVAAQALDAKGHDVQSGNVMGEAVITFPNVGFNDSIRVNEPLEYSYSDVMKYRLRVGLSGVRVLDMATVDHPLTEIIPNVVLNGFDYPPSGP